MQARAGEYGRSILKLFIVFRILKSKLAIVPVYCISKYLLGFVLKDIRQPTDSFLLRFGAFCVYGRVSKFSIVPRSFDRFGKCWSIPIPRCLDNAMNMMPCDHVLFSDHNYF